MGGYTKMSDAIILLQLLAVYFAICGLLGIIINLIYNKADYGIWLIDYGIVECFGKGMFAFWCLTAFYTVMYWLLTGIGYLGNFILKLFT